MPIPVENNSWDYVQRLIEREISSAFKLRTKEDKMAGNWGINELYNMGFDGECIGTMRKLTPEQVKRLVEILDELRKRK